MRLGKPTCEVLCEVCIGMRVADESKGLGRIQPRDVRVSPGLLKDTPKSAKCASGILAEDIGNPSMLAQPSRAHSQGVEALKRLDQTGDKEQRIPEFILERCVETIEGQTLEAPGYQGDVVDKAPELVECEVS